LKFTAPARAIRHIDGCEIVGDNDYDQFIMSNLADIGRQARDLSSSDRARLAEVDFCSEASQDWVTASPRPWKKRCRERSFFRTRVRSSIRTRDASWSEDFLFR